VIFVRYITEREETKKQPQSVLALDLCHGWSRHSVAMVTDHAQLGAWPEAVPVPNVSPQFREDFFWWRNTFFLDFGLSCNKNPSLSPGAFKMKIECEKIIFGKTVSLLIILIFWYLKSALWRRFITTWKQIIEVEILLSNRFLHQILMYFRNPTKVWPFSEIFDFDARETWDIH
jgi:hypothetical protein